MNKKNKIEASLIKMIAILKKNNVHDWANALERCQQELSEKPIEVKNKILSMYGGMGSLNDIIFYNLGQPLSKENTEFANLRSKLYYLCRE